MLRNCVVIIVYPPGGDKGMVITRDVLSPSWTRSWQDGRAVSWVRNIFPAQLPGVQIMVNLGKISKGYLAMTDKKRIVCIEDEPETTNLVKLILAREGFEVLGANGGEAGLAMVREELPDLILLDLMMPDMDGWQVYQHLKEDESTRDIPVIVVTAKVQSIDKVLGLQVAKVDDYITKPFRPEELSERVKYVLSQAVD